MGSLNNAPLKNVSATLNGLTHAQATINAYFKSTPKKETAMDTKRENSPVRVKTSIPSPQLDELLPILYELDSAVDPIEYTKIDTTASEPEFAVTHFVSEYKPEQPPQTVKTMPPEEISDDEMLKPRKRAMLFEDESFASQVKAETQAVQESTRSQIEAYEFNADAEHESQHVTVGTEDRRSQEDSVDYKEREKYINCRASQNSLGFKQYVDNYYRYKGEFQFPPWLEVRNIRDKEGNRPTDEAYDPSTVWIPPKNHRWAYEFRSCHYTECMQQWWTIKQDHFDSLVFFKMGRFYELFYHDACILQNLSNLRWMGSETKPHVGFPEKSLHIYATACVNAGYRVVVVEQTETPHQLEKRNREAGTYERTVKRDVCEIITPGTVSRPEMLGTQSRPLVVVTSTYEQDEEHFSVVSIDVSMSKIRFGRIAYAPDFSQLKTMFVHLRPAEVVLDRNLIDNEELVRTIRAMPYAPEVTSHLECEPGDALLKRVTELYPDEAGQCKSAMLLAESYLKTNLLDKLVEYAYVEPLNLAAFEVMSLDFSALTHLELFLTQEGNTKNSLFDYLNKTKTAFGERLLRSWLLNPLTNVHEINKRNECVAFLVDNYPLVTTLHQDLEKFPDMERSLGKIVNAAANYHKKAVYFDEGVFTKLFEFYTLMNRFQQLEDIVTSFLNESVSLSEASKSQLFDELSKNLLRCGADVLYYKSLLRCTEPKSCQSLDWKKSVQIHEEINEIRGRLDQIVVEIQETAPSACYVNCKFRYEVEMTETEFQRYQKKFNNMEVTSTRSGFVRGRNARILQILEELEEAEFRLKESEEEFYQHMVLSFHHNSLKFCKLIDAAAQLDCLASLATVAKNSAFPMSRPVVHPKSANVLRMTGSVYPLYNINPSRFVPNDLCIGKFEGCDTPIVVITGPNMGGKSTLLRQIALTVIMGQIGSFVSATSCEFSVVDSVFTRLGASDNLAEGKSTFLVELQDISAILAKVGAAHAQATASSLALIDELGRGTSTFDGTAIAAATLEKISKIGCRCVFTTHFQDVCLAARDLGNVAMFHMSAKVDEATQNVEFLYKLVPGVCPDSHGLHVAKLARIPEHVLLAARNASLRFRSSALTESGDEDLEAIAREILAAHENHDTEALRAIYDKYKSV